MFNLKWYVSILFKSSYYIVKKYYLRLLYLKYFFVGLPKKVCLEESVI